MNEVKAKQYIYTYRYLWQTKDNTNICVKVVSGVAEEHAKFIEAIKNSQDVVKCSRVYMSQVDVDKLEEYEPIKTEVKK